MNKYKLVTMVAVVAALGVLGVGLVLGSPDTLKVDNGDPNCSDVTGNPYCTIQAAVDDASSGDTIKVDDGTYNENVTINKDGLTLEADSDLVIDFTSSSRRGEYDSWPIRVRRFSPGEAKCRTPDSRNPSMRRTLLQLHHGKNRQSGPPVSVDA